MRNKQSGQAEIAVVVVLIIVLYYAASCAQEISESNFKNECNKLKGVVAGNVCIKPDSVIKTRHD